MGGVDGQSKGIMPLLAARRQAYPVGRWHRRTVGKLGATARRVRYRMIGDINDRPDVLIVCVGSNDMLAGRSVRENGPLTSWCWTRPRTRPARWCTLCWSLHPPLPRNHRDDQPVLIERLVRPLALAVLFCDVHSDFRFHGCQKLKGVYWLDHYDGSSDMRIWGPLSK